MMDFLAEGDPHWLVKSVVAPLVVVAISAAARVVIAWLTADGRWKRAVYAVLVLAMAAAWCLAVGYGAVWWFARTPLRDDQLQVMVGALVLQVLPGYLLFWMIRKDRRPDSHPARRQWKSRFNVVVRKDLYGQAHENVICVRHLGHMDIARDRKLPLTYRTVCEGVEFLVQQIRAHSPEVAPDICVGINHSGATIASLLATALAPGKPVPLGIVRTQPGTDHRVCEPESSLPNLPSPKLILLVDREIKSGRAAKNVAALLRAKYPDTSIMIAALVAARVKRAPKAMEDLIENRSGSVGNFLVEKQFLPDFLAFTCQKSTELVPGAA